METNRVLIVDDDSAGVRLLERLLRSRYTLSAASSGEEALAEMARFHPDLVLLDINLPGMDGYEICRRIRRDPLQQSVKIFLVSGLTRLDERLRGYEAGADDYVTKPFHNEELLAKIGVHLKLRRVEEIDSIKRSLLELLARDAKGPLEQIARTIGELMSGPETPGGLWEYLGGMFRSTVRLTRFVEKADRMYRLENGEPLDLKSDLLRPHLSKVLRIHRPAARQKEIEMTLECPSEAALTADWEALDEVLGYLLDNAIKFSGKGGRVSVTAEEWGEDRCIYVTDEGEGIETERLEEIFSRFAVSDLEHHQEGQGLSLAVARQTAKLHGGELTVQSTPGQGSSFCLRIPVLPPNETVDS